MPYDNIKSHKKPGFHRLFRRYIFRKTTEGSGGQITSLPLSRFRVNQYKAVACMCAYLSKSEDERSQAMSKTLKEAFEDKLDNYQ